MKTAAIIYTLITITNGATVRQESGFKSLRTCEQAKSLALYGLSIEDKQAKDDEAKRKADEARRKEEERKLAWQKAHPPRLPANEGEKKVADADSGSGNYVIGAGSWTGGCPVEQVSKGIVRDIGSGLTMYSGGNYIGNSYCYGSSCVASRIDEIKAALCVIEPSGNRADK